MKTTGRYDLIRCNGLFLKIIHLKNYYLLKVISACDAYIFSKNITIIKNITNIRLKSYAYFELNPLMSYLFSKHRS